MKLASSLLIPWIFCVGLSAIGCSGTDTPAEGSGAGCKVAAAGTEQSLSFSTSAAPYTLDATTRVDPTAATATTTWAIRNATDTVLTKTVSVANGTTTTILDFGPMVANVHHVALTNDGVALSGAIDGRPIVPVELGAPRVPGGIEMADRSTAPTAVLPDDTQQAIQGLLDSASASLSSSCQGAGGGAISALSTALDYEHGSSVGPKPAPLADVGTSRELITYASGGVPTVHDASIQNNPIQYETPHCQSCQSNCFKNLFVALVPGGVQLCGLSCLIPVIGGCAENICPDLGACDSNETCCGNSCCGSDSTCGSSKLGVCCPKDHPVGCGDSTGAACFSAGSTCCGDRPNACPAGQLCGTSPSSAPTCCTAGNLSKSGQCCDKATCGGACCDQGTCLPDGTCCPGPVAANNTCCGFTDAICNGQCCAGSCTSTGACCTGAVCGSACCGQGQVCLNASTSTCGAPTQPSLVLEDSNGVVLRTVEAIEGSTYEIVGSTFVPGTVNVTLQSSAGTTSIGSATVGSDGSFTLSHVFEPLEGGGDILTATEGSLQATLAVTVVPLP